MHDPSDPLVVDLEALLDVMKERGLRSP